jgi:hypothetical protein
MSKKLTSVDRLISCLKDHLKHGLTIDARVIEKYGHHARLCHENEILEAHCDGQFNQHRYSPTEAEEYFNETFVKHETK